MNPQRIQLSRKKGWRMPPNTVKVDRSTKWGNPFIVGKHGDHEYSLKLFQYLCAGIGMVSCDEECSKSQDLFLKYAHKNIDKLEGKNLACWCPLGKPCHADLLLIIANKGETPSASL